MTETSSTSLGEGSQLPFSEDEQAFILNRVDDAIALLNADRQLVLFNQKFLDMWALTRDWLEQCPGLDEILDKLVSHGLWTTDQQTCVLEHCNARNARDVQDKVIQIYQADESYIELSATKTSNEGQLLIIRDLTIQKRSQEQLAYEVRRLRFLLGLTERLQNSDDLEEIGEFALSYLVESTGAAFGDVKMIHGQGKYRYAGPLVKEISGQFIAAYGEPVVAELSQVLQRGIPYGEGLLWEVADTGKPLFIEDYANHPKAVKALRHPGIGQLGIFPIPSADGIIIGVVTLESRSLQKLQEAPQQDILLAACRTLGAAIERAQSKERLERINRDLEKASRLKSEFLASMSHEFRTPLNSILGFSELLLRHQTADDTRKTGYVQAIRRSGQHLLDLINDILDLSKVESGKFELDLKPVSIQNLCRDCLNIVRPRADRKRLSLTLELDYHIDNIKLDDRRVRQMVINLLSNAIKFTPEKGKVRLSAQLAYGTQLLKDFRPDDSPVNESTPYICLTVADTGIGIPEEKRVLLFRPFQQIDASLTRHHDGTGLGLALTKRLAEMHGGTVSLKTEPAQGSTFRIWLPINELRESGEESTHHSPEFEERPVFERTGAVSMPQILVVEDQPYNQALISEILELEGFGVTLVDDGRVMMTLIESPLPRSSVLPDIILMDIQLPSVDGLQLIRELKTHPEWCRVPVIAVTAMAMAGDRARCLGAGADDYIQKPIDFSVLIQKVSRLIGQDES